MLLIKSLWLLSVTVDETKIHFKPVEVETVTFIKQTKIKTEEVTSYEPQEVGAASLD